MMTKEKLLQTYEKELKEFEDWINENPRLPKDMDKLLLLRFLKVYDFNLEEAKKLLVNFLEMRKKHPHIFSNRDINSEEFEKVYKQFQVLPLKNNTKENHKITVFRLTTKDASDFVYVSLVRFLISMLDSRLIYCDPNELIDGEISICDVSNFTLSHFMKIISHIGTVKAYMAYTQESAPIKIIQSHFINCSPIMNKFMTVMKPFIRKEVWESMKFHSSLESLYEFIPKDILPIELGGTENTMDELYNEALEVFKTYRDYLLYDDNWKIED